jgi:maltooligosyltrehalose trehalohydrolase
MGEEFGASQPFPFFCHFESELAQAVREGRRAEFAKFPEFQNPETRELIPDPTLEQTFLSAKLDWSEIGKPHHAEWVSLYRELLAIRHREIMPRLHGMAGDSSRYVVLDQSAVAVQWRLGDGSELHLAANLSGREVRLAQPPRGRLLWPAVGDPAAPLPPWTVLWTLDDSAGSAA